MSIEELKKCPFCGEEILKVAIVCKHCKSDLETGNSINKNKEEDKILILFKSPFTFVSIIVLIGMFLPWTKVLGFNAFSILKLAELGSALSGETDSFVLIIGYFLYAVPILIGMVIFFNYQYIIYNKPKDSNSLRLSSSIPGFIIIVAILRFGSFQGMSNIFNVLGIGAIISLIGSIILMFLGFGMNKKNVVISIIIIAILGIGTFTIIEYNKNKGPKIVKGYLNAIIGNNLNKAYKYIANEYIDYKKIAAYTVKGYKILNNSEGIISAEITFQSKSYGDLKRTHSFKIQNGKIIEIDGNDGSIRRNEIAREIREEQERIERVKREELERIERKKIRIASEQREERERIEKEKMEEIKRKAYNKKMAELVSKMEAKIEWVKVSKGQFKMGSNNGDSDETPVRSVYLDTYYISKYEVTFEQYDKFCEYTGRKKPSDEGWSRGKRPVINVSWEDAKAFCNWLSRSGKKIKLPTEAQWEKAARGGNKSKGYKYSGSNVINAIAWYRSDFYSDKTHPVGQKQANELGLYDMSGNVWEWCSDWYGENYYYYTNSPKKNPKGPSLGTDRVIRGGSWNNYEKYLRSADRYSDAPTNSDRNLGFRLSKIE